MFVVDRFVIIQKRFSWWSRSSESRFATAMGRMCRSDISESSTFARTWDAYPAFRTGRRASGWNRDVRPEADEDRRILSSRVTIPVPLLQWTAHAQKRRTHSLTSGFLTAIHQMRASLDGASLPTTWSDSS